MPARLAPAQEVTRAELQQLRREIDAVRAESAARIQALEERLRTTEARAALAEQRLGATESVASQAGTAAQEAITQARGAVAEAQGTSEAFRDFSNKPRADLLTRMLDSNFEFHGYMRSGAGISGEGGDMEAFKAPGAFAKYRLGNEVETYGELLFKYNYPKLKDSAAEFNVQVRLAYVTNEDRGFPQQDTFLLPEAFVQAKGVIPDLPETSFWAGERFYRRIDVHINDFYLSDHRGYGGGVEDVPLFGPVKLALAYIGSNKDDINLNVQRITKRNVDLRIYSIPALWGEIRLWSAYGWVHGGTAPDGTEFPSQHGPAFGILYDLKTPLDGLNKIVFQYGRNGGATLTSTEFLPPPDLDHTRETFRVTEQYTFQPASWFAMQFAAIYQSSKDVAQGEAADEWMSVGARPVFFFTKHLGLAIEGGWDHVKNDREKFEGSVYKLTIAPKIQYESKFFGRPEIRLYATFAWWDEGLKGRVGGETYRDNTSGASFGIQAETWW